MWNAVIDLLLVALAIRVRLADTFGDNFRVAFLVTGVATVFALIAFAGKKELLAQCAHDRLVELSLDKLVSVHLKHIALALAHSALTSEGLIWPPATRHRVLDYTVSSSSHAAKVLTKVKAE